MSVLRRMWQAWRARVADRRCRFEFPDIDQANDTTPPADVEAVATYLWAATCWDRGQVDMTDYALAAVIWLNYGLVRLPDGARPLDDVDLRGIPVLPYRDQQDITPVV